jgi:hypothetical protein
MGRGWGESSRKKILIARHWWLTPSYSGGRDQEDQGLKPAQGNSS